MKTTAATGNNTLDSRANVQGLISVDTAQTDQLNTFVEKISSDEVEESLSDDEDKEP